MSPVTANFIPPGQQPPTGGNPQNESDTHGIAVAGATATTATETALTTITLPAGGDWKIFGLWGQIVPATGTAAELIGGSIRLNALSGDLEPDPAPSKYPLPTFGSFLGATAPVPVSPLQIWPVAYTAPGKAQLQIIHANPIACTVAPQIVAGIIFGRTIPTQRAFNFVDFVETTVTANTDTQVGTIQLAEKARFITAVGAYAVQDGVLTAGEELLGYFRLDSDDIKMTPMELPMAAAFGAGVGATIGNPIPAVPQMIPTNIPVVGGARVDCFVKLNTAVTNGANVQVYIAYM